MKFTLITPKMYYNEFQHLLHFIRRPIDNTSQHLTIHQKIKGTWMMFVVKFVLAILVGVSIGIFYDAENITKSSMAARFSIPVLLLISVLILPLLEEIAFRLSLKFKPFFLALSLGVLTYYMVSKGVYHTKLSDVDHYFLQRSFFTLMIAGITYVICSITNVRKRLELFWVTNFKWLFYGFCLVFAWIHIFNYELSMEHLLLMPIITLDKLVSAFCYAYTRVTYGFVYSLGIHMLNNSIGFMVMVMAGTV